MKKSIFCSAGITAILFLVLSVCVSSADDYIIINNTMSDALHKNDDDVRNSNENAAQKKIEDFKKAHPNSEIVYIDESGKSKVLQSGTGADRLVYIKRPLELRQTLEYIDGSGAGMNTNRSDPNRKIKNVILCGSHGQKETEGVPNPYVGRTSYLDEQGRTTTVIGTDAWKKEFTSWERSLAARGMSSKDFFKQDATTDVNSCYAARGQFPQYLANIMPKGAVVNASKSAVIAGGVNFLHIEPGWRSLGVFRWKKYKPGEMTNSEITSKEEINYITTKIEALKKEAADFLSGKTTVGNKNNYYEYLRNELANIRDMCGRVEPNPALDNLDRAMSDLSLRAGRGELTNADLVTLSGIAESISKGNPISIELQERARFGVSDKERQRSAPKAAPPQVPPVPKPAPEPPPAAGTDVLDKVASRRQARQDRLQGEPPPPEPTETQSWSTADLMQEGSDRYLSALEQKMMQKRQARGERVVENQAYQAELAKERELQMQQAAAMIQQVAGLFATFNAANQAYQAQHHAPGVSTHYIPPVQTPAITQSSDRVPIVDRITWGFNIANYSGGTNLENATKYTYVFTVTVNGKKYNKTVVTDHFLNKQERNFFIMNFLQYDLQKRDWVDRNKNLFQ